MTMPDRFSARVIGYDLRLPLDASLSGWAHWDPERRRTFLLRRDLPFPLSADGAVWPEALGEDFWKYVGHDEGCFLTWGTRAEVVVAAGACATTPRGVLIASTAHGEPSHWHSATPEVLPEDAHWLGYDVVDEGGLSVLMNHGWPDTPAEIDAARTARWSPHLNAYHLFEASGQAKAFLLEAQHCDDGAHGQFCVVGVWALSPLR